MSGLVIDWTRCDGHGLCAQVLPEAIRADEWGYPIIANRIVARLDPVDVRRAVALCPALALRFQERARAARQ
jgi:ferredoxin